MGTSDHRLGIDEWVEDGVKYARTFRDKITMSDTDKQRIMSGDSYFVNHYFNSREQLVATYPNATAVWSEEDPLIGASGKYYVRVYERIDYPAPGWPPTTPPVPQASQGESYDIWDC